MIDKVVEVEWDIRLETLIENYHYQLIPACDVTLIFEDGTQKDFHLQIGDRISIEWDDEDLTQEFVKKMIARIQNPLKKEIDELMGRVERINKCGSFKKKFLDQFWVENMMGK